MKSPSTPDVALVAVRRTVAALGHTEQRLAERRATSGARLKPDVRHFPNARHQTMPQFSTALGEVPMPGKARLAGILGHRAPCPGSHLVGFVAAPGTSSGCHRCPYPAPTRYGSTKFAGRSCVVASLGRGQIVHAPFVPTASVSANARRQGVVPLLVNSRELPHVAGSIAHTLGRSGSGRFFGWATSRHYYP